MHWIGLNDAAHALVLWMAGASLRAIVLAILAGVLASLVRRRAAAKHLVWTAVLAGMLALPFLRPIVPAAHVPLPRALTSAALHPAPIRPSVVRSPISAPMPGSHPARPTSKRMGGLRPLAQRPPRPISPRTPHAGLRLPPSHRSLCLPARLQMDRRLLFARFRQGSNGISGYL